MEQKLQELLDKIYTEGVAKGEEVATTMVRDAEREATHIREQALHEAREIRRHAQEEAEELKSNVASELRQSASQSIHALKQQINRLIVTEVASKPIQQAFSDEAFIKQMIETLIQKWQPGQENQGGLSLMLPKKDKESLEAYFSHKAQAILNNTLQVTFEQRLEKGFRIGPADGSYVISFTDKDFEAFFLDYLRPKTKTLLYGDR